jgi:hypothetical protein
LIHINQLECVSPTVNYATLRAGGSFQRSSTYQQTLTYCCFEIRVAFRSIEDSCPEEELISLRTPLALLATSLGTIAAVWWWLAIPIHLARAPIDPNAKLQCVSYAPFRAHQSSLSSVTQVSRQQIAEDLDQLAKISDCVRTYAIDHGLDQIPELAAKVGLKVIQGIFLDRNRQKNSTQISTAIRLAREYPETISALVVGNEVLLHRDMTVSDLAATIRSIKAQVAVPVTYADVWEVWLRNRELRWGRPSPSALRSESDPLDHLMRKGRPSKRQYPTK